MIDLGRRSAGTIGHFPELLVFNLAPIAAAFKAEALRIDHRYLSIQSHITNSMYCSAAADANFVLFLFSGQTPRMRRRGMPQERL